MNGCPKKKDEYIEELERSIRLLSEGKLVDARFILEDMAFRSPKDQNVLYNLGMCYSDLGDLDIAIETLNRCVKIVPLYSNAYIALGVAYGRQSKLKDAVLRFMKVNPSNPLLSSTSTHFYKLSSQRHPFLLLEE